MLCPEPCKINLFKEFRIPAIDLHTLRTHINARSYRPQSYREICAALNAQGAARRRVRLLLQELRSRGEIVRLHNRRYVPKRKNPQAPQDPSKDTDLIIERNDLPARFPKHVLSNANGISDTIPSSEVKARKDLRKIPFVTIDGEDAKDFDDAIALEDDGTLWVAIADVSHYVHAGDEIDVEAAGRGNSYYFPDRVLPMLPEKLSNGLCSLKPRVERLAVAVQIPPNEKADPRIFNAVIKSTARLTYTEVDKALRTKNKDGKIPKRRYEMLSKLRNTTLSLYEKRMQNGGIDFELSEAKIILRKDGTVASMSRRTRTPAQHIVEELMLLANRKIAKLLSDAGYEFPFRSHGEPEFEKIKDFLRIAKAYGYRIPFKAKDANPANLAKILAKMKEGGREKVFTFLLLRAMQQAKYAPKNWEHYGLGFEYYCHFTSPIRRYADLIVHRVLKQYLSKTKTKHTFPKSYGSMNNICVHISETERVAITAEREMQSIKAARFLADKIGKEFKGSIVGIIGKGIFVELDDHAVEGMVHVRKLGNDYFEFKEQDMTMVGKRSGKAFRLGDPIKIRVDSTSIEKRQIDFSVV